MTAPLLNVEHLTMRFGGLVAVNDVSFEAAPRQITSIIGPNGAGKTTVFNCLTGFYKPTVGRLTLATEDGEHLLERMDDFRIAQIAGDDVRPVPQLCRQLIQRILVAAGKCDRRALRMQRGRNRAADPARCAGDQRLLVR